MKSIKKQEIWISDLTHTAQGISSITFPLGLVMFMHMLKNILVMILTLDYLNFLSI